MVSIMNLLSTRMLILINVIGYIAASGIMLWEPPQWYNAWDSRLEFGKSWVQASVGSVQGL